MASGDIVAAYVSNIKIGGGDLYKPIGDTHQALTADSAPKSKARELAFQVC